jgi:hypothetical protein
MQWLAEILVLIGAILALIWGLFYIVPVFPLPGFWYIGLHPPFAGFDLFYGILVVIFAIITLLSAGFLNVPKIMKGNWVLLLLLGFLMAIFGGHWGAWLVIIGALMLIFV